MRTKREFIENSGEKSEEIERGGKGQKGHGVGQKKEKMDIERAEDTGIPLETVTPPSIMRMELDSDNTVDIERGMGSVRF